MRRIIILFVVFCILTAASAAYADAPTNPTTVNNSDAPPVTEQELQGEWRMGTFYDYGWIITFRPDHTMSALFEGVAVIPAHPVTWTLTNDSLTVNTRDVGILSSFHVLKVVRYKSSVVLVPQPRPKTMRDFDYNPITCFWQTVVDKKYGKRLPRDAADFMHGWQHPLPTAP